MSRKQNEIIIAVLGILIVVFIALNGNRFFARIDLTETKAYTISEVSERLFEEIDEQVKVTYYVSSRLTDQFPQTQQIADLLAEYAAHARGTIVVNVVDPSAEEIVADVEALGVVPRQLEVAEAGEQTVAVVYSGIVIEYLDRMETLPFVFSTATLEYEVTSTIRDLVEDRTLTLGVLIGSGQPMRQTHSFMAEQLGSAFEVRELTPEEPIADDVDVVVALSAQQLSQPALIQLDQYIMRGGHALIAADAANVNLQAGLVAQAADGRVGEALERYGVRLSDQLVLDQSYHQIVVQEPSARMLVQRVYPYPLWVRTLEQFTSAEHPVTSRFSGLDLYWPSYLEPIELDGVQTETIVATTPQAWLMSEPFAIQPNQSALLRLNAEQTTGQYGLVAVVAGSVSSAFTAAQAETAGIADYTASVEDTRLVVIADGDVLDDRLLQATQSGANLEFVLNVAQWLANDEDLMQIRTRATRNLRLDAIQDPAERRTRMVFAQAVTIYLVPAALIVAGLIRFFRRRRRALGGRS